jgi:UDP-N-acetylmuramoyl-tripeptide--D-alanyl-D-alanine ligase
MNELTDVLLLAIAALWGALTVWRVYRLARFYQIEEYKANRFAVWWLGARARALPPRALTAGVLGAVLCVVLGEGGPLVPALIALVSGAAAGWLPAEVEVKKAFVPTARAKRLLAASWLTAALAVVLGVMLVGGRISSTGLQMGLAGLVGLAGWLLGPLWLMLGNLLTWPIEEATRRYYVGKARATIRRINPTVVGITGSYGKTTTKNFVAGLLDGFARVYPTPKSFNTMLGVSRAINADLTDHYALDYFIVEMGAYFPGEIKRICGLTPPRIGIVTEVGPMHLERFKTLERTMIAKYELIAALPADGVGIFNWDNDYVRRMMAKGHPRTRIGVSKTADPANPPAEVRLIASDIRETLDGLSFVITDVQGGTSERFEVPVAGEHNVTNLLCAVAVGLEAGMTLEALAARARMLQPAEARLVTQRTAQGITIINDAYSANPIGARSALRALGLHTSGRRVLITPGMVELGELMERENRALGEFAAAYATDVILVGGERTRPIAEGLRAAKFPTDRLLVVERLSEAIAWTQTHLAAGDTVLYLNDLPDTY